MELPFPPSLSSAVPSPGVKSAAQESTNPLTPPMRVVHVVSHSILMGNLSIEGEGQILQPVTLVQIQSHSNEANVAIQDLHPRNKGEFSPK